MHMIQGILFDFDGTLSNRKKAAYNMYRQCIAIMREDLDPEGIEFENLVQFCMIADQYGIVQKDYVWQRLKDKYIPDLDIKKWTDYWYDNFSRIQIPAQGAKEALETLGRKYRIGILSNGAYESQFAKVKTLGYDTLVDEVVICGQYGISKPDERIFRIACEKLGTKPEETLMVGDMFFTDIYGALRAGLKAVWYTGSENFLTAYPVKQIHDYNELLEYIANEENSL